MAEFKNLTSQIEVIRSVFDDTISYYKKSNSDEVVQLGVYALDGVVYLAKVDASGNVGTTLENFPYSEITAPVSTSIDNLVETINTWLHDEVREVTVDTPFTGFSGITEGIKISEQYLFTASNNHVLIDDSNFGVCVSIFNETIGKMLYIKGSEDYTGETYKSEVTFRVTHTGMANDDTLCILYKSNEVDSTGELLSEIITELKINNNLINKYLG